MSDKQTRIGLIGLGTIGMDVYKKIQANPQTGMQVVFVHDTMPDALAQVPAELVLEDMNDFAARQPDLVIEMAHKDVTKRWAPMILPVCDMMAVSVTVIADERCEKLFEELTAKYGTRLYLPHGGAVGLDSLHESRDFLDEVHLEMRKNPMNVDTSNVGIDAASITKETVLYDGPTRAIAAKFPRNVNTLTAIAYAGIGLDKTRSTLIVNPEWDFASMAVHAKGPGVIIEIERREQITGVTGTTTPASIYNSIQMVANQAPGIHWR
jgi:aspartate dehydrogenase